MSLLYRNAAIVVVALIIPLAAELSTATPEQVPGTGFAVLLYEPFDFAFVVLVGIVLAAANTINVPPLHMWKSIVIALCVWVCWFVIAFLLVGQLHLSLGGKL